mmetsp:Transcript_137982/g.239883  ORF Transcript_137982/g.239883 Transcript_137982/m.239883 type:complete len:91 (+) Transcript_137982:410-682(+)
MGMNRRHPPQTQAWTGDLFIPARSFPVPSLSPPPCGGHCLVPGLSTPWTPSGVEVGPAGQPKECGFQGWPAGDSDPLATPVPSPCPFNMP